MTHIPGSYIRDLYGVDAFLNGPVRFEERQGHIVDFDGQYLLVQFGDDSTPTRLHPTWVDYLDAGAQQVVHRGEAR